MKLLAIKKTLFSLKVISSMIIGFDYKFTEYISSLNGCINDAKTYSQIVETKELITDNLSTNMFHKHKITKTYILNRFENMISEKNGKVKIFVYSGHGMNNVKKNHESIILPYGEIIDDDEFDKILKKYSDYKLISIFDSCNSGDIFNLPMTYEVRLNTFVINYRRRKLYNAYKLNAKIIQLSACKKNELSYEDPRLKMGVFSSLLIKQITHNDLNKLTYRQLLKNLQRELIFYGQHPVISTNFILDVDQPISMFFN